MLPRRGAILRWLAVLPATALVLAGCSGGAGEQTSSGQGTRTPGPGSGSTSETGGVASPEAGAGAPADAPTGSASANGPDVVGIVTAVDATTATVEGSALRVRWSSGTTILRAVPVERAALATGACVVVFPVEGTAEDAQRITAAAVRVLPTEGGCGESSGRTGPEQPGGDGARDCPTRKDGPRSKERPGCREQRESRGGSGGIVVSGAGLAGTVVAADRRTLTVATDEGGAPRSVRVRITDDTRLRRNQPTPSDGVEAGLCLTAWGEESGGLVRADRIQLTEPATGTCG